ncbi:MAG: hypothetical protein LBH06_00895 [Rikenellaceae bacterium]|jgi:hypothetical protein|nr:hypothetical protein [Rikenellaceae bacterium]
MKNYPRIAALHAIAALSLLWIIPTARLRRRIRERRLSRLIDRANRLHRQTGYKYMILSVDGRQVMKPRRVWKDMCRRKIIRADIHQLDRKALYITH